MAKKLMSFRLEEPVRGKLHALALGERASITSIIERLIMNAPVERTEVTLSGLALRAGANKNENARTLTEAGVFATH